MVAHDDFVQDLYHFRPDESTRNMPLGPGAASMNPESTLFGLPRELRMKIYEYAFEGHTLSLVRSSTGKPKCLYTPPSLLENSRFSVDRLKRSLMKPYSHPDQDPSTYPHLLCRVSKVIREEAIPISAACTKILLCPELPPVPFYRAAYGPPTNSGSNHCIMTVSPKEVLNLKFRNAINGLSLSMRSTLVIDYKKLPKLAGHQHGPEARQDSGRAHGRPATAARGPAANGVVA
ncbi:uncharacterized protein HMPREF1541_03559 [Cyphellophora europaea CBS 101466]|uniref:F-box domain-containing protein n=1 Tax=Cyphellophora europaea (strain CBS 101466) TaxID=1220924 RepID=W2S0Q1_CYPE1|nr:uncharacterized protein HMPREF1541_03559 [Cyphellophora europaea CBS 101466]ETN41623.1 hypothetical protein HMPREF1541_03559 [Cyphellophora europaea CBS 101466]